jgi:hypothetical protein
MYEKFGGDSDANPFNQLDSYFTFILINYGLSFYVFVFNLHLYFDAYFITF